ncbi:TonB-dependent receptor [Paraferrimonas sedimenticola]|uniref:Oar protein n=1 Tax=Paraferrimonas sedimenticola TaxID=375674 RepID=A0AA37VWT6_9GAMM|nr:TonB-dependent receptor [Paraferrimonas sedimenticola]GLP95065.1 Oar protein [Paraferrimonas sedimenticola]
MTKGNKRLSQLAVATCLALGVALPSFASETASNIRGQIVSTDGVAVTDAKITIIHGPTGTTTELKVNEQGNFVARGLRVGGPYTIVVDSDSHQDDMAENIYLNLGETLRFTRELSDATAIERIAVVGSRIPLQGAGSNSEFSAKDIANAPGISRDLKDVVRQNPFAVVGEDGISLSVAGLNPRFNTFVVDGVQQNDDFGLNSNGYPTQRSPISIEAVESVALNTAPFSVKYGGFTGAQINAVTKSGTNEVKGSVFYEFTGDQLAGNGYHPDDGRKLEQQFEETTWGGSVGLPLIKDKLFFFGSYENFDAPKSAEWGPDGSGFANKSNVTQDQLDEVREIAERIYGLNNIGDYNANPVEKDEKILAKVDWNVNDDHRVALTYQQTTGNVTIGTSDDARDLNLSTNWYDKEEILKTYAFNLYSDWNENFTSEFKVAYKDVTSRRNPVTPNNMGQVEVKTGTGTIVFGTEESTHANELDNQNLEIRFVGNYLVGDHEIVFGFQHNDLDVYNVYGRHTMGTWSFDSIEDFENGVVENFEYQNHESGDKRRVGANWSMTTTALFIEDIWSPMLDLDVNFGVRYETIGQKTAPDVNQNFVDRYGFANNATFDGKDLILPRVGFKYYFNDDLTFKGGIGRYSGGSPNVWMSNSFTNDGQRVLAYNGGWQPEFGLPDFTKPPQGAQDALMGGDGNINTIDPNFKMPSDWRMSLGFDSTLDLGFMGEDWSLSGEALYIERQNDVRWVDLARRVVNIDDTGRVVYETYDPLTGEVGTDRYDLMLTNALEDGSSQNLSLALSKEWDSGFRIRGTYAFNKIKEGNQGSSSTAESNFQYTPVQYDRNGTTLGPGNYETPHRFTLTAGYDREFFDGYNTGFNLFYEARSGRPLTWVLGSYRDGDLGDQSRFNSSSYYLPYIPTGADDKNVEYGYGLTYDDFMAAVNELGLGKYAGQIIPKGTSEQPWVHSLDFRFTQEVPGFTKEHKGVLYFDIKNVLNLVNKDWGHVKYQSFGSKKLVDYDYDPETGVYTYSVPYGQDGLETQNWNTYDLNKSTWQLKVGVRYVF